MQDQIVDLLFLNFSLQVHMGEDDLGKGTGDAMAGSQTTGNAGGRLACCTIEVEDNTSSANRLFSPLNVILCITLAILLKIIS